MLVEPEKEWITLSSDTHTTIWDQKDTLFDVNYNYLGVPADECFHAASKKERR
jgi:hypothetical protein